MKSRTNGEDRIGAGHVAAASLFSGGRALRAAIPVTFLFSGVSALFYQVIWLRQLSTVFGNTTLAISVTLTAFMTGLAVGSYALGRLGDRAARPFRAYAWLEIGIGLYGLASLKLLHAVHAGYVALAAHLPFDSFWLVSFQFWASFLALVIPTALMGGTLPVASKGYVRQLDAVGRDVGRLYGINTLGAALGVLSVGFFLLPVLGLQASVFIAACINLLVGIAVLGLDAAAKPDAPSAAAIASPRVRSDLASEAITPSFPRGQLGIVIVGFAVSGFSGLALEVAWTRALSLYTGSSVYAFSAILLSVLIGIAVGSLEVARIADRHRITLDWFAGAQIGASLSTLALVLGYNSLCFLFLNIVARFAPSYAMVLGLEVVIIVGCLLLPTVFSGATLPILSRVYVRQSATLSRRLGFLYAANTVGCIMGAFAAGFILIPAIGLRGTVLLCAAFYMATAAAVLFSQRGSRRELAVISLAALAVAIIFMPRWRPDLMSSGFFRNFYGDAQTAKRHVLGERKVIFYREGSLATVAVVRWLPPTERSQQRRRGSLPPVTPVTGESARSLIINGKVDASDVPEEMDTQTMLAHLPMLLAPRTADALVVGLGSGTTAGAAALYPVRRIDCIEIEPTVLDAARYFRHINRDVFADPRFHLIFADARNYLAATRRAYDVIICEPSNPWVAGVASLFTVEHFRALRGRLADDGVICQWLQLYEMSPRDMASVVATFVNVFPDATLWWTSRTHVDVALIAQKHPWKADLSRIAARSQAYPRVARDLRLAQCPQPITVLSLLALGPQDLRRLSRYGQLNTDDLPELEFSAPRNLYRDTAPEENQTAFGACKAQPLADIANLGAAGLDVDMRVALAESFAERHPGVHEKPLYLNWVREQLRAAVALAPRRADLYERLTRADVDLRDLAAAQADLARTLTLDPSRPTARELLTNVGRGARRPLD